MFFHLFNIYVKKTCHQTGLLLSAIRTIWKRRMEGSKNACFRLNTLANYFLEKTSMCNNAKGIVRKPKQNPNAIFEI